MKKNIILAFVLLMTLTTFANARFFLGIDAGYSMDSIDTQTVEKELYYRNGSVVTIPGVFIDNAYKGNGYILNFSLGTEHHFDTNQYIGFRWFFGLGYGRTKLINQQDTSIKYPSNIIEAKLGLDLLLDVVKFGNNSLGLFFGVEAAGRINFSDTVYIDYDKKEIYPQLIGNSLIVSPRIGLSLFLDQHHRIEFVAKIPAYTTALPSNGESTDAPEEYKYYKPIQFMLGYKFVF